MKFKFLVPLLFSIIVFFSFTSIDNQEVIKKSSFNIPINSLDGSCVPTLYTVFYANNLTSLQIWETQNHYITKYGIQILPAYTPLPTTQTSKAPLPNITETWYLCYNCCTRPGHGGLNKEIDEDPDLNFNNPNAM